MASLSDDDDGVEYEEVDVDDEGVRPSWFNRGNRPSSASAASGGNREMSDNGGESRPHPQAIVASILKGDKPVTVQRSNTVKGPPPQPLPRTTPVKERGPPMPAPNAKKVRPPAPPPPNLKTRSATVPEIPLVPPKPGYTKPIKRIKLEDTFLIEKEEYTPDKFVKKYSDKLPLHVRVSKGYYGSSESTSVSEGDTFNIHFIKNTKVVNIEDGGGTFFNVALNSAIQFGFLFDPNNSREEALAGRIFDKVSDLLPLKTLPKALRASVGWRGSSGDCTVEGHEQFIVRGWKRKLQKKVLKVYNPVTKEKKELPESCECKFSTCPYDNRLYLADILDHVTSPFPGRVVMYLNIDSSMMNEAIPTHLSSSVVTLKGTSTNTSLVASGSTARMFSHSKATTVEIPFDLDIEFQVMYPKEKKDTDDLYQSTREILDYMTTAHAYPSPYVICSIQRDQKSEAQSALYSIVREGSEMTGVDIVKPANIYANLPAQKSDASKDGNSPRKVPAAMVHPASPRRRSLLSSVSHDTVNETDSSLLGISIMEDRIARLENAVMQVESTVCNLGGVPDSITKMSREITSMKADMIRTDNRAKKAMEDVGRALVEIEELRSMVERLKQTCASFQGKLDSMAQSPPTYALPATPPTPLSPQSDFITRPRGMSPMATTDSSYSTIDEATCESNREFLATLDFVQVLSLLECMGLKKHHEAFMEERVNGEILLECDDAVLQEELKVTSKIQRSRLMKLIQGKYSAKKMLQGEDPYMYARAK